MFPPRRNKDDMILEQQRLNKDIDFETVDNKRRILMFLSRMPASYLGEIAWESGLSEYQARLILNVLRAENKVEQLTVNYDTPDPRLIMRVPDQSHINQAGYTNFSRKRWFSITPEGREYLVEVL